MVSFINCPVDLIVVNENRARVSAFIVLSLLLFYLKFPNPVIPAEFNTITIFLAICIATFAFLNHIKRTKNG